MDRALKPSLLACVGVHFSFSRKVPWLINWNFQKYSVAVVAYATEGQEQSLVSTGPTLAKTYPFYSSLLIPNLNLSQD